VRVGIDAMLLWGEWTGIGRAIWELACRLSADGRGNEFVFYSSRAFKRKKELVAPHFHVKRTWFSARTRTLRILWEQLRLPGRLVRDGVQVLHAPAYVMPLMSIVPTVVTVHDLIALKHPDLVRKSQTEHLKRFLPKTLARAQIVMVPSKAVARDLRKLTDVREDKIRVVPFGVGEEFKPLETESERVAVRALLELSNPYVLFVGRIEEKKNLPRVVEAFFAAVMAKKLPHDLVLAGPAARSKTLEKRIVHLGIGGRVKRLGYLPDEKLPILYGAADALLFPSKAEGFGFPLLEAMACGTPCVISKDPALVELSGGAALKARDDDLLRLRETLEKILTDPARATQLREKGLRRAREFTWDRTVELTLDAYTEAVSLYEAGAPAPAG
jgi:glycosyltransferase involved in cell wall biosynthesis